MNHLVGEAQNYDTAKYKDLEKVYVMDFKYIKMKKSKDDDVEDKGKINFYIINKKYKYMKQFFSKEMFKNLLIAIVVDLDNPQSITKSFIEWHEFIMNTIREFLDEMDINTRNKIFKDF